MSDFSSPRFKTRVHWTVWEAAQRSYITWRWPALCHRVLAHCPLGERRGTARSSACAYCDHKPSSYETNTCLSRLWCLLSTAGRALRGSPTRQCCRTSPRLPTSAWLSFAPTPCWATWSPRPRGIQRSPAGWAAFMTWRRPTTKAARLPWVSINFFVFLQYYYSIKDISVGGRCVCHGHAQVCGGDSNQDRTKRFITLFKYLPLCYCVVETFPHLFINSYMNWLRETF